MHKIHRINVYNIELVHLLKLNTGVLEVFSVIFFVIGGKLNIRLVKKLKDLFEEEEFVNFFWKLRKKLSEETLKGLVAQYFFKML